MQLVLQGPIYPETEDIVRSYLELDWIDKIIVSCWETCPQLPIKSHRVVVLYNSPVEFPSTGNLNRQLLSSAEGLRYVTADYAAKMRTDQKLSHDSLRMMDEFFWRFREGGARYVDGSGPRGRICVLGNYTRFPFHPRDHVFWGRTEDLLQLFDLPLCPDPFVASPDFTRCLRPEAWIGAHYCARKDRRVARFLADPQTFLTDGALRIAEALLVHDQLRERVFRTFPRIDLRWPKYGLEAYDYATCATLSEYWAESW